MKKTIYVISLALIPSLFINCGESIKEDVKTNLNPKEMKAIISENSRLWSKGLKEKNMSIFENLYDVDAHYLPDKDKAINGNKAIAEYWKASFAFLEDVQLTQESLEGTKELLYETGKGIAILNIGEGKRDTLHYKYVNVWKLQEDGSYKVVIDTFNELAP